MKNEKRTPIILAPITDEEKKVLTKVFLGNESLYVLYRRPMCPGIQIGMLSESMRKYSPETANCDGLDEATEKAYFYNGCSRLEEIAPQIIDRPIYKIYPSDEKTVDRYQILNRTHIRRLKIRLTRLLEGTYKIYPEPVSVMERKVFKKTRQ